MARRIAAGTAHRASCQSPIAFWAMAQTGIYNGRPKIAGLRAMPTSYIPRAIQLVSRRGAASGRCLNLQAKRISLTTTARATLSMLC